MKLIARFLVSSVALSTCVAASFVGAAFANPNLTDADQYPHQDHPPTYIESLNKVIDLSSDPNLPPVIFDGTFRDLEIARQFNGFRAMVKDMYDMQTLGDQTIRTRDLASPFTTQLSCYSSFYRSSGIDVPPNFSADCPSRVELPQEVVTAPVISEPAPVVPRRRAPAVPALW